MPQVFSQVFSTQRNSPSWILDTLFHIQDEPTRFDVIVGKGNSARLSERA